MLSIEKEISEYIKIFDDIQEYENILAQLKHQNSVCRMCMSHNKCKIDRVNEHISTICKNREENNIKGIEKIYKNYGKRNEKENEIKYKEQGIGSIALFHEIMMSEIINVINNNYSGNWISLLVKDFFI